jgi:hypothetical protein
MKNYISLLMIIFILCLSIMGAVSPVRANSGINIIDNSVDIHFPGAMVFKIKADSNSDITDIRLHYIVNRMDFAETISEAWPIFAPSTSVDTQWIWDMRYSLLPPNTEVEYWWVVKNEDGDEEITDTRTVRFSDNSHNWKKISSNNLTIFWYEGDENFADEAMQWSMKALDKLADDTGARLEQPIQIFLYADSQDLLQSMIFPREWTGGVAHIEYNKITIIMSDLQEWSINALAHELGHLATHQITFSPYGVDLPLWLDEGLAMYAQFTQESYLQTLLKSALDYNALISLRTLCSPFSAISERAALSYAESYSVVEYLIKEYGRDKILDLLIAFKEGNTYDDALLQVYGFDLNGLESRWISWLTDQYEEQNQAFHTESDREQIICQAKSIISINN